MAVSRSRNTRYGIQTIWVDEYAQIPQLLRALEAYVTRRGVFVSGAADDPSPLGQDRLNDLSRALGREIIRRGFNLVSGFGLGIAEQTILGAFHAVYNCALVQPAERVLVRPFPGNTPKTKRAEVFRRHREDMISRVGAVVVLAGNKKDSSGKIVRSPGVDEEVEIALQLGKPVIPVGQSGHVAGELWQAAIRQPDQYLPGIDAISELMVLGDDQATIDQVVAAVVGLLQKAEAFASAKIVSTV